MNILRIKHDLTLYHWRYDRKNTASKMAICSCGKRFGPFRSVQRTQRWRSLTHLCWLKGHDWEEEEIPASVGPAGAPDEEFTDLPRMKQCNNCYRCENV